MLFRVHLYRSITRFGSRYAIKGWPISAVLIMSLYMPTVFGQDVLARQHQIGPELQEKIRLAESGNQPAQLEVARSFNEGLGTRRDFAAARKWFQRASDAGSTEATAWLGSMYLFGNGVDKDLDRARSLIQAAADAKDPVGMRFQGMLFETGQGVDRNLPKAAALYGKACSRLDGNACDRMGLLQLRGFGMKRNPRAAFASFAEGARLGDQWAELHLGQMYHGGHVYLADSSTTQSKRRASPKPDYLTALRLYQQSAAQGNRVAAFKAAQMYAKGEGIPVDDTRAFEFFKLSASRRYTPALIVLGEAHETGRGTAVNLVHAFIAYSLASEQGSPDGSSHLRSLLRRMTPDQVARAQAMLKQFRNTVGLN